MKKYFIAFCVLLFASINSHAQSAAPNSQYKYTGLVIDPHCGSLEKGDFQPDSSPEMETAQIFASYGKCGDSNVIWLSKMVSGDIQSGQKIVLDRVDVRTLAKGEKFVGSGTFCYLKADKQKNRLPFPVIFKGWNSKKPMTRQNGFLKEAWQFNSKLGKIEKATPSELDKFECIDESDGED